MPRKLWLPSLHPLRLHARAADERKARPAGQRSTPPKCYPATIEHAATGQGVSEWVVVLRHLCLALNLFTFNKDFGIHIVHKMGTRQGDQLSCCLGRFSC
jgi:hypothetical protein